MPVSEAASPQNQIAFPFMSESELSTPGDGVAAAGSLGSPGPTGGLWPIVATVAAAGTILLAVIASGAGEPVLLTIMAGLAMAGVFFFFGLAAGHIRVGERTSANDVVHCLAETLDDGILVTRRDGALVYGNAMIAELAGRPVTGGLSALHVAFSRDAATTEAMFRLTRAAERGEKAREEFRIGLKPGQPPRLLHVATRPFTVPGQRTEREPLALWTVTDVTGERAREANAVQTYAEILRAYDQMPAGLLTTDVNGQIRHMNAALARWLGMPSVSASRGLRLKDLFAADGVELLNGAWRNGGMQPVSLDVDATREDGRLVPVRLISRKTSDGGLSITVLNRENEPRIEHDGSGPDMRFSRFFQSAPFGIASVTPEGRISGANAAFARMIVDASSGLGEMAVDVLCRTSDAATRNSIAAGLTQVLAGKANPVPIEITVGLEKEHVRRVFMSPSSGEEGSGSARGRHSLCHRRDRAKGARSPVRAEFKDGSGRQARRRHRARFQQRTDGHHRLLGSSAADASCVGPRLP